MEAIASSSGFRLSCGRRPSIFDLTSPSAESIGATNWRGSTVLRSAISVVILLDFRNYLLEGAAQLELASLDFEQSVDFVLHLLDIDRAHRRFPRVEVCLHRVGQHPPC